jgi:hypothetical protein
MTLPRNRNVGRFADMNRGHTRFDNPTSNPRLLQNQQNPEREFPDLLLKIRAEWIRAGKFAPNPHAGSARHGPACPGHDEPANKAPNFMDWIRPCPRMETTVSQRAQLL